MKSITGCLFASFLFPVAGLSQQQLMGKVIRKGTPEVINGVTVLNYRLGKHNISDIGGNYRIEARAGDTIIFSSTSYHPDTLIVRAEMLDNEYFVYLDTKVTALPSVEITEEASYRHDSIARREEYAWLLNKKHPVKLWNEKRRGDNPGLSFSPIGYYSREERNKRRLKKRLKEEEEDYYIDFKFPRARVAMLTGLKGDSLQHFMIKYRPTYKWCRTASGMDVLLYINEKLVLYRKGPERPQVAPR